MNLLQSDFLQEIIGNQRKADTIVNLLIWDTDVDITIAETINTSFGMPKSNNIFKKLFLHREPDNEGLRLLYRNCILRKHLLRKKIFSMCMGI